MSSSGSAMIKADEMSRYVDEARNMLLKQCWLYLARKRAVRMSIELVSGRLWDKRRPLRSFIIMLAAIVGMVSPVVAKFYFDLNGFFNIVLGMYQWGFVEPQSVLFFVGVISSHAHGSLKSRLRNAKLWVKLIYGAVALLVISSVALKRFFDSTKLVDAVINTWIWCVIGPALIAICIDFLTSSERNSKDKSKRPSFLRHLLVRRLFILVAPIVIFWGVSVALWCFPKAPWLIKEVVDILRWCFADCIFIAILIYLISWCGNKDIESQQITHCMKWFLTGSVVVSVVLALIQAWNKMSWPMEAMLTDVEHYSFGIVVVAAFVSSSGWDPKIESDDEPNAGKKSKDDPDSDHNSCKSDVTKWAQIQFSLQIISSLCLMFAMLIVVWLSFKQAQEGDDGFLYAVVPAYLAATCLIVGVTVESSYIPLRRVPYVDIVCVSKFMKSTGWALFPVPFMLVLMGAFIRNIGKSDDRIIQVIGFSLTFLTWIASYLRQQRRWYVEYVEAREKLEEKLDYLAPKIVSRSDSNGTSSHINTELECSKNEVEALIRLVREGVSLKYSSMPLIPAEILSLYIASRICMWPIVRRNLVDYWSLGEVPQQQGAQQQGARDSSEEMYELFGRLIVEFEALPSHIIKCIKDDVKNLAKCGFECDGVSCGKKFLAADILVRETVFSGGIFVR